MYLFLAVLGLRRFVDFSLIEVGGGCSLAAPCGLLTVVASLVAGCRLCYSAGSMAAAHGLRCSETCIISPDQGLNP